jgi:hypothetical protein
VTTPTFRLFTRNFHHLARFAEDAERKNIEPLDLVGQMNEPIVTNAAKIEWLTYERVEDFAKLKEE